MPKSPTNHEKFKHFLAGTLLTPMGRGRYFVELRKASLLVKLVNRLGGSRGGSITIPINMGVVFGNTKS